MKDSNANETQEYVDDVDYLGGPVGHVRAVLPSVLRRPEPASFSTIELLSLEHFFRAAHVYT